MPSSECGNISFLALARHACERAHVRGQTDRQTGGAEAKLHVGHSCSSGSCFQRQIFIHRTCERSVQDGRIQAACTQASPASRRMACARRPRAPKHRGVKFSPGFPRPLTLPAPFGLTALRTYARTRRRSSRPSQRERRPRCVPLFAEQLYKNLRSDQKPT